MDVGLPTIGLSHGTFDITLRRTSNVTRKGKARNRSVTRINRSSIQPPRRPANAPMATPRIVPKKAEANPIKIETRSP